ncbi:unnamed protein product [Caenorhabditis brenneri]
MSVQKKTHNKKKKKDKPSKAKPGSAHSKLSKHKDSKGKKLKKHSKGHVKGGHKKKRSKPSKSKKPTTEPIDGPFTAVPQKKKKKEKKVKRSKSKIEKREEPGKVEVAPIVEQPVGQQGGSGRSLKLEKTQMSDDSIRRKKEKEEKKKKKEMEEKKKKEKEKKEEKKDKEKEKKDKKGSDKKEKEPKVKPVAPTGSPKKKSPPAADKKVSNLYKIVGEISDTKSSLENKSPPNKVAATPEAKTPETEGPPLEKKESPKYEKPKEEPKEGTGYDEPKLESDRDNLDDKPADAPVVNKENSGSKKKKKSEESLKLNKTQSLSPVNIAAPIEPGPPGKQYVKPDPDPNNEILMETPPLDPPPPIEDEKEKSDRVKIIEPQRSEIEQPIQEPEFVEHHGDTRVKKMEIKKVDLDLVGRTGMYLERFGMSAERKSSFDWIAYNRHDMKNKQKDFSKHMATALSDIGIHKQVKAEIDNLRI